MIFRGYNHKIVKNNNIAMRIPNGNDKAFQDPDGITTYPQGSNFTFIKYFNDITNSIKELKKMYKGFTKID